MSKELELAPKGWLTSLGSPKGDGPTGSDGQYFEGELHGLTVRVCRAWEAVNGYVKLPEGHPWSNKDLFPDDWDIPADVHGGITYHEGQWIGFDTNHYNDVWLELLDNDFSRNMKRNCTHVWTPEELLAEVDALALQAVKAGKELTDGGHSHIFGSATEADVIDGME